MSKYHKTIAHWTEKGLFCIDFEDDLGREYRLKFAPEAPRIHYDSIDGLSEYERKELEMWERNPCGHPLNYHVKKFINASFMEWRELIEFEEAN